MERSLPAAAADGKAVPVPVSEPVPASRPLDHYWQVFERVVVGTLAVANHGQGDPRTVRLMRHAYFAGARAAFASVMEAFGEIEAGDVNGDVRLAAIEREVAAYFSDVMASSFIANTKAAP